LSGSGEVSRPGQRDADWHWTQVVPLNTYPGLHPSQLEPSALSFSPAEASQTMGMQSLWLCGVAEGDEG
jgi:hypothetical protein